MNLDEYKTYVKNVEYMQKLFEEGHEMVIVPCALDTGEERAAMCTKSPEGAVFPHAILIWEHPEKIIKPLLLTETEQSPIITKA